jgi:amino acid permease
MKELSNPTLKRKEKVIMKTIAIILIIYFMVATSGYLTFLDESEPLILINYEGVWSMIAKGIMTMTLFFGVPLTIFACRNVI